MTSKISYWVKWKENVKRRNWTFVLCFISLLFAMPISAMIALNNTASVLSDAANKLTQEENIRLMEEMASGLAWQVGFSNWMPFLAGFLAILLAVQGFSFLYSRRKMDLYMSVPVSSAKRFVLIWINGILVFGASYLICLILTWFVGIAFHVMTATILVQSLLAFFVNMLAFAAMYHVALVAVMLCGNVMTALLGCGVLLFYEAAVKYLFVGLKSTFFESFCNADEQRMLQSGWLSPFVGHLNLCSDIWYEKGKLVTDLSLADTMTMEVCMLGFVAVAGGILAYVLFRKRKTESYTQAIAFGWLKPVLEFFLLVPFAIAAGVMTGRLASDMDTFLFAGTVVAALIGHAIIRMIYERDLRAILQKKALMFVSMAVSIAVLCVFKFDLIGYDYYLPDAEQIDTVSVTLESDYNRFGRYRVPFEAGRYSGITDSLLENMNSGDPDTIEAVLTMVRTWQESLVVKEEYDDQIPEDVLKSTVYREDANGDSHWMIVRYQLKNGREVYRRFYVNGTMTANELDTIMTDEAYQKNRYQIYLKEFEDALDRMRIQYYDGKQNQFYTLDKKQLLETYKADFAGYDYSAIVNDLPCGLLRFSLPMDSGSYQWSYPVYQNYENTIDLLSQNDIAVNSYEEFLSAEDVKDITVTYYHYDDNRSEDSLFEKGEIEEQRISVSFEKPDEIRQLLAAIYPEELRDVAGEEYHDVRRDDRFDVILTLSSSANKKRYMVYGVFFLENKTPDFVSEKIKEAAVR